MVYARLAYGRLSGRQFHGSQFVFLCALAITGVSFSGGPAAAQDGPPVAMPADQKPIRNCVVTRADTGAEARQAPTFIAACWGTGVYLGQADTVRSFANPGLEATAIELERDGARQVLLIRPDAEGQPLVEDLGGELAVSVGRGPWLGIEGLSIDFGQFAERGSIAIADLGTATGAAGANRSSGRTGGATELDIAGHIATDSARIAAAGTR